ncbi:glycosyltransferase family 2 protein [Micromonospora echinospora]|uniref:glycosyltransferase family 2 protein n=1 Tax=Micromonospora echinospora TaxID=1877 RepID=UPI0037B2B358
MTVKLSVVVPIYNVEPYLSGLLDSLAAQDLPAIEFILVDDGSTDGSPQIAESRVRQDRRFTLVSQENRGISEARNAGTAKASGQYLAFADADDIVAESAYRMLVESLDETGSDLATGDVRRLHSAGTHSYGGYGDVFATDRRMTHITRDEMLIADRMVWNKVFRRSFWDAQALRFTLRQYEDAPLTMRAHIAASSVDVISRTVYFWRIREAGEPSITQRPYEPDNVFARMLMMVETGKIIDELAPSLSAGYARDMLLGDVRIAMLAARFNSPHDLAAAVELVDGFLRRVDPGVLAKLPVEYVRRVRLLAAGRFEEFHAERDADEPGQWWSPRFRATA